MIAVYLRTSEDKNISVTGMKFIESCSLRLSSRPAVVGNISIPFIRMEALD